MSKATNTKLMDTEPGGENTQYESQDTFVRDPKKSTGQLGTTNQHEDTEDDVHRASAKAERGEKTAENIRYGEAISEHGFGGETVGNSGSADNASGGQGVGGQSGKEGNKGMRRESMGSQSAEERNRLERMRMGYGAGSGVGG
ncbi:hypothetical protein WAI453_005788 [Rhynchosporium graminicola]|uniref:Uncharacterized protein n=1 Tax=Rhynchosporium graminicola TaxID=2792576 RepID=A0A1E1KKC3_9HELO|nr:uncharacterized protein RCO7_04170 [Rhynchosporium commune]